MDCVFMRCPARSFRFQTIFARNLKLSDRPKLWLLNTSGHSLLHHQRLDPLKDKKKNVLAASDFSSHLKRDKLCVILSFQTKLYSIFMVE